MGSSKEKEKRSKRTMDDNNRDRRDNTSHHSHYQTERSAPIRTSSTHTVTKYHITDDGGTILIPRDDVDMPDAIHEGGISAGYSDRPEQQDPHRPNNTQYSQETGGMKETLRNNGKGGNPNQKVDDRVGLQGQGGIDPRTTSTTKSKAPPIPPSKPPPSNYSNRPASPSKNAQAAKDKQGGAGLGSYLPAVSWPSFGGNSSSGPAQVSASTRIRQLEDTLRDVDDERRRYKSEKIDLQGRLEVTMRQRIRFEDENKKLRASQEAQESQVRMAQELMLKKASKTPGGLADEDKTIRHNFKNLQTSIRNWGRDWANQDITSLVKWLEAQKIEEEKAKSAGQDAKDPEARSPRAEVINYLAKVIRIDDDKLPKALTSSKMQSKSPAICLSALISNEICQSIFEDPFFPLQACISDPPAPEIRLLTKEDRTLAAVYQELSECDEKKAQAWRCQTLEILDPSVGEGDNVTQARHNTTKRRLRTAKELADEFLKGPPALLLHGVSAGQELRDRVEDLQRLFQEALEISARLWKQPTILRSKRFGELALETFTADSDLMDAHPLHQLGLSDDDDEDSTRLDHHRIMMVVSPAILGMGDSDGDNYWKHRIWAKAVVWLED